jgi:hypothetical protein
VSKPGIRDEFWLVKVGAKFSWAALMTLLLASAITPSKLNYNLAVIFEITWSMVALNAVVLSAVVATFATLVSSSKVMAFSWLNLFGGEGTNINVAPVDIRWFGFVFLVLFAINLPYFAYQEEMWFRNDLTTWREAIAWSILFGLVHCIVGVPIGAGVALSIGGLWFSHCYFTGGVDWAMLNHTTYNLIVVSIGFVSLTISHFVPNLESISATEAKR